MAANGELHFAHTALLAATFGTCLLLGLSLWWAWMAWERHRLRNLHQRLGIQNHPDALEDSVTARLLRDKAADATADRLGRAGDALQRLLRAAGESPELTPLVTRMALLAAIGSIAGMLLTGGTGVVLGLAGLVPLWTLQRKARKRTDEVLQQLPDALDLMARAMQAGMGLSETFGLVATECSAPVDHEFAQVHEGLRFGKDWKDALGELIERNPRIFDLRLMTTSLLLQRETGGNTIDTLQRIAQTIRARQVFHAKVAAMTSEARASGFILGVMPLLIAGLLILFNPSYLAPLVETPTGRTMLGASAGWYGMGLLFMRSVTAVKV